MSDRTLISLLEPKEKKHYWFLIFSTVFFSFIEALALALIIPYIHMLQDPLKMLEYPFVESGLTALGLSITSSTIFSLFSGIFLGVFVLRTILFTWISYDTTRLSYNFFANIAQKLQKKYLGMRYIEFSKKNSNLLVKNCTKTAEIVGYSLVLYLQYISSFIISGVLCLLVFIENPIVSFLLFGVFGSSMLILLRSFKKKQKLGGEIRESTLEDMHRHASESFHSFKEIQIYGKLSEFLKKFKKSSNEYGVALKFHVFYQSLPPIVLELVAVIVLISAATYFVLSHQSISELVPPLLFYAAVIKRLMPNVQKMVTNKVGLQNYQPSINLVKKELSLELKDGSHTSPKSSFKKSIEFRGIGFSYTPKKPVLQNITFSLKKNQTMAFVGPSGAGKSTLIEIFTSLLSPDEGSFVLDEQTIACLIGIRHLIGYVPQQVNLLDESIAKNIAFGEEKVDFNRLGKAIKMAHLEDFISTLSNGVDTMIGEQGIKLSGGQRQRIAIARALYFDPEILIFDEATSSLDNVSEKIISNTIQEIAGKKTIIAVAHRLTTVQHFDVIHVMDKGRIIASGRHDELIECCPVYRELNLTTHYNIEQDSISEPAMV